MYIKKVNEVHCDFILTSTKSKCYWSFHNDPLTCLSTFSHYEGFRTQLLCFTRNLSMSHCCGTGPFV